MIKEGLGSIIIFLGIACLVMKMIPEILSSELLPKMRLGFTTLTQKNNSEQKKKAPWLTYPKKFKRGHSTGKVMSLIVWDSQGVTMIDYLEQGRTINGTYYAG